jgi:hypothetical protein
MCTPNGSSASHPSQLTTSSWINSPEQKDAAAE